VLLVALAILPLSQPAEASVWDDIWMTRNQQAQKRLQQGEAADAVELFDNPDWRAVAQYRAEDYAESAAAFAENENTRSLYNLGNALARQGELESAIDAYEQVLEIDPDNADAEYNRDLLAQLLEQQQEQQQESSDQQGEGEQSESDGESQESSESESGSEGEPQEGDSQRDEEEASQEDLDALQEELQRAAEEAQQNEEMVQQLTQEELEALRHEQEQQQAMEQWLRRIPNDPGGLLRRKFRYQYQKTGKDQDGNDTWPDDEVQPW